MGNHSGRGRKDRLERRAWRKGEQAATVSLSTVQKEFLELLLCSKHCANHLSREQNICGLFPCGPHGLRRATEKRQGLGENIKQAERRTPTKAQRLESLACQETEKKRAPWCRAFVEEARSLNFGLRAMGNH